ncbi:MAG: DUF3467 domain-containing protein [Negativicutes bacterium]|nr:DUF3467 domain-containing protein [Negativicutes bacterium]
MAIQQSQPTISVPSLYANFAAVNTSVFDFTVLFGMRRGEQVSPVCEVAMSPQHAKAFAQLLMRHVEEYEEKMGEIRTTLEELRRNDLQ